MRVVLDDQQHRIARPDVAPVVGHRLDRLGVAGGGEAAVQGQHLAAGQGDGLFRRLQRVTDRYLEVVLEHVGDVPEDMALQKSVQAQKPVLEAFPGSPAAQAFRQLARTANQWPLPAGPSGRVEFFMERMLARPAPRLMVLK